MTKIGNYVDVAGKVLPSIIGDIRVFIGVYQTLTNMGGRGHGHEVGRWGRPQQPVFLFGRGETADVACKKSAVCTVHVACCGRILILYVYFVTIDKRLLSCVDCSCSCCCLGPSLLLLRVARASRPPAAVW
jgi:hypothetical protein